MKDKDPDPDPDPGDPKRPDPTGSGSATLHFFLLTSKSILIYFDYIYNIYHELKEKLEFLVWAA